MVMRDFAAPTAKCAINETIAATTTAGIPVIKKKGTIGMNAPSAVESAPETAETIGLTQPLFGGIQPLSCERPDELAFVLRKVFDEPHRISFR